MDDKWNAVITVIEPQGDRTISIDFKTSEDAKRFKVDFFEILKKHHALEMESNQEVFIYVNRTLGV